MNQEIIKANVLRKSYFFNKLLFRLKTRLVNLVVKPYRKKKKIPSKYSSIVILMRPNNTFLSVRNQSENKLHLVTAGTAGFKGPQRSSPYSRHVVARIMSYYLHYNGYKNLDIYFNSLITRRFFFFFKGLIVKPFFVRYIARNKMVSHGFMRKKKKRRK